MSTPSPSTGLPEGPSPLRPVRHRAILLALVLGVAGCAGLFYAGWLPRQAQQQAVVAEAGRRAGARVRVRTIAPRPMPADAAVILPATIEALRETAVFARTGGYLRRWLADLGDAVKAGQSLAEIDTPELDQDLELAKANLMLARANQARSEAGLVLAKSTLERSRTLGLQFTSQQDIDTQQGNFDMAVANQRAAVAAVAAGEAGERRLRELKSFAVVAAPFDGMVTQRNTEVGALITAGGGTAPPLFRIMQMDAVRVFIDVPQVYARSIRPGQEATVTTRGNATETATGRVTRSASSLDPQARTMRTELQMPNPAHRWLPGMSVQVTLNLAEDHAVLMVPANALLVTTGKTSVATVDAGGHLHITAVVIDVDHGAEVGVSSGLTAGDRVVLNVGEGIEEGMVVEVLSAP